MADANCVGLHPVNGEEEDDIFFPGRGRADLAAQAKRVCSGCIVQVECGDFRERTESLYGIWGNSTTKRGTRQA